MTYFLYRRDPVIFKISDYAQKCRKYLPNRASSSSGIFNVVDRLKVMYNVLKKFEELKKNSMGNLFLSFRHFLLDTACDYEKKEVLVDRLRFF